MQLHERCCPRPAGAEPGHRVVRLVVLADSDSYVKWGAALAGTLPPEWERELLVVDTPLVVSDAQLAASLIGTGIPSATRITPGEMMDRLHERRPDAVLVAAPGPIGMVLTRMVATMDPRPVIVEGMPGISIPVTRKALQFRRQADLMIVHSRREVREFGELSRARGWDHRLALATLPFASREPAHGTDMVFAAQAIVPRDRERRLTIARTLRAAALADPTKRVVVKVRTLAGELQTHPEDAAIPDLIAELGPIPPNLVVASGSMSRALDTAEGLVTVSSTSVIEAIARGIPVIAIDDFGVSARLINPVFEGSGMLAPLTDVVARRFHAPRSTWLDDNYFHGSDHDDWIGQFGPLVDARREGRLAPRPAYVARGGRMRAAWDRKKALGDADRSLGGRAAVLVGTPARVVVRRWRRIARQVSALRSPRASTG